MEETACLTLLSQPSQSIFTLISTVYKKEIIKSPTLSFYNMKIKEQKERERVLKSFSA